MSRVAVVIVAVLLHAAAGCGESSETPLVVTFTRQSSGSGVQSSGGVARVPIGAPLRFTVEVRNASERASTIDDIQAVVMNADGDIITRAAVASHQAVMSGVTLTLRQTLWAPWGDDAVLGVAGRFDGQAARSGVCRPLCPGCDAVKTQRACERLDLLLKTASSRPDADDATPPE